MFLAGVPVVRALERMGARPVPIGAEAGSERMLRMAELVRPRALACTPSYAQYLAEQAPKVLGRPAAELGIEIILCAGEPGAGLPEVRAGLQRAFGARVYDLLGGAHGVMCCSCDAEPYAGMHVLGEDCAITTQLVDQETKAPIPLVEGAIGERVKTSLRWEAQPQLRASVGDVYQVHTDPCSCGVPGLRIRVLGRTDDLLIVKGVKIYPAAVKNVVQELRPLTSGVFRIVLDAPPPRVEPPLRITVERGEGVDEAGGGDARGRAREDPPPADDGPARDHRRARGDVRADGAEGEADRAGLRDRRRRAGYADQVAQQPVVPLDDDDTPLGLEEVEVPERLGEREERLPLGDGSPEVERELVGGQRAAGEPAEEPLLAPVVEVEPLVHERAVALDGIAVAGQEQVDVERRRAAERVEVERERAASGRARPPGGRAGGG